MSWCRRVTRAAILAAVCVGVDRRQRRWGATSDEVERPFPGDEIVPAPDYEATNAITIAAPPAAVWPWLVQMGGYVRAGWYSFDRLDNGGVPSAREIIPDLQDLHVGDVMATARDGFGFRVEAIDPERSLVLSIRHPDATTSSVFVLDTPGEGVTRLLVRLRLRARPTPRGLWYRLLMELGHVVMTMTMLRGIRARAERTQPPGARVTGVSDR
jgi:hypothetical protein